MPHYTRNSVGTIIRIDNIPISQCAKPLLVQAVHDLNLSNEINRGNLTEATNVVSRVRSRNRRLRKLLVPAKDAGELDRQSWKHIGVSALHQFISNMIALAIKMAADMQAGNPVAWDVIGFAILIQFLTPMSTMAQKLAEKHEAVYED